MDVFCAATAAATNLPTAGGERSGGGRAEGGEVGGGREQDVRVTAGGGAASRWRRQRSVAEQRTWRPVDVPNAESSVGWQVGYGSRKAIGTDLKVPRGAVKPRPEEAETSSFFQATRLTM